MKKNKLELTWIGKDKRQKFEPRIFLEGSSKSHHAKQCVADNDVFDNKLIFGDNLLALKAKVLFASDLSGVTILKRKGI